jgi:SecD/SecF fusion protein
MKRNNFWKWAFVVFIVAWALWEINPPTNRDLVEEFKSRAVNTDTNFTAILERVRQLQQQAPTRSFANLQEAIGTNSIARYFPYVNAAAEDDPTLAILHRLQRDAAGKVKLGLDLQGGSSFLVEMDTNQLAQAEQKSRALAQAVEVLRKRVDQFGVAEPLIQPESDNRILIQLPGLSEQDKDTVRAKIQRTAFLEFRLVHPQSHELISQGLSAIGYTNMVYRTRPKNGQVQVTHYLIKKTPERGLTGKYVKNARPIMDPGTGQPEIEFTLNDEGAALFADVTKENVGRYLAIILDGEVKSAPVIKGQIPGGRGVIEGDFTVEEAYDLASVLMNPLEAPVHIAEERSVDPSLGRDSIRSGIKASIIGTIFVSAFMLVYYMFAGLVANVALITNMVITMGVMCSLSTTLTLPGIAGMVLTIGMAVDANVLIYERIREELAKGKSMRGALSAGYDRAFGTIFDSHVTTLISSVILIFMGTGSVKGFGFTLTFGVASSLFTALVVTRIIFDWVLERGWLKSLRMLHLIRSVKLDFMKLAKPAFILSWTVILIGLGYGVSRGSKLFGVDFVGGDTTTFGFQQKMEVEKVRDALTRVGEKESLIQYQGGAGGGAETLRVTTSKDSAKKVQQELMKEFPQAKFDVKGQESVGPTVGKEIQQSAVIASLLSLFGILIYVAFRYEFSFAVGAVVAVIHDVLMTIGCYCMANGVSGREFNATVVAAVLTIIGFSINDTIVIFDRIREDLKLGVRGSFKDLINQALNQTLSRTIITSGTVFLATIALYIFGGGVINDFAFTFLVGIITGTYSSIYIASALVLWWHKGHRPKGAAAQMVMDHAATTSATRPAGAV